MSETNPAHVATVRALALVYGREDPDLHDPAELYHEASKVARPLLAAQLPGVRMLYARTDLQVSARRSVRRNPEVPRVRLPEPALPATSLAAVLRRRRSARTFGDGGLSCDELSALLFSAYGVTAVEDSGQTLRTAPSGGGLYPLELFVAVLREGDVQRGLYHYDPPRHALEVVAGAAVVDELTAATAYPDIVGAAAAVVLVSAVFWRTRFKYGLRGYRFALLEAGHVAQNVVLAAEALDLAALPLGGYFDRPVDELLRLDGVNESTIYAVCVGRRVAT